MGMLVVIKDWVIFQDKKRNRMELSEGRILEENQINLLSTRRWEINTRFHRTIT